MSDLSHDNVCFRPTASLQTLRRRATLYRLIRNYFDQRNFVETTTPVLSRDVVVDRFVEAIPVNTTMCWQEPDGYAQIRFANPEDAKRRQTTFYLQTSPEFAMKRLLAAGLDAIYQLAPAFRLGDRGATHNVEFTMLEWYQRDVNYQQGRRFLADLVMTVAREFYAATNCPAQSYFLAEPKEITFGELFENAVQIDPHQCACNDLQRYADEHNVSYPESFLSQTAPAIKDDWLDLIFSDLIQPNLGRQEPTIVYDYPATQSQLAKTRRQGDHEVTSRFELFVNGVELANGYDELLDPAVLRARIDVVAHERRQDGSTELPRESRLLAAMDSGLPPSSGCALGVDRLLYVLIAAQTIDDVIPFPIELA
ncbi:MAG: EF-P lysine aminoacylase EpmA [Planctomycetia bacterium]|nr:EF-P lysine aminoacylase EpmA [Planctomycetia bacterium]